MFRYTDNKDRTFLFGAYRGDKPQLDWILGSSTQRYEKLYNVRFNQDLFSQRNGGILSDFLPDYVLIYNTQNPQEGYHLFPCVNSSVKEQEDMEHLDYPDPNGSYMVYSLGDEVLAEPLNINALIKQVFPDNQDCVPFAPKFLKGNEIANAVDSTLSQPQLANISQQNVLRFIDLFAGIGGIRCGLEQAAKAKGYNPVCVFTSEIKPYAVSVLQENHPGETITGDITKVDTKNIPEFDILCAGFPCQAFSSAGKRQGFADTRGTLFFEVERILRDKRPKGFILENVEGLVNHDGGQTLKVIIDKLSALN